MRRSDLHKNLEFLTHYGTRLSQDGPWHVQATVHGLDPVTRRPYTHTIPTQPKDIMQKNDVTVGIRFTRTENGVLATLASQDRSIVALAIEKPDAHEAAAELVKAYFTLDPLAEVEPSRVTATGPYSIRGLLLDAVANDNPVVLRYRDVAGNETERRVQPKSVGASLLSAFDLDKNAFRSFRLDSIQSATSAS